ncbi:MAG: hypothetical protein IPJ65_25105 [Archangiaceae bacterium]|nr:hypothetical protein [Archangiaceae bacterium]
MLLRRARWWVVAIAALAPALAHAQRESTREALTRLEETLELRLEDGTGLHLKDLTPVIIVSVKPAYEETKAWYPTQALNTLVRIFGAASVRSCEACMGPRVYADDGYLEQATGDLTAAEITRLDQNARGKATPARAAVWLDENGEGISLKIVDLKNSRIVLAENFDMNLSDLARTRKNVSLARELDRRARGDGLTHIFVDFVIFPGQHFSMEWDEQWGDSNCNLSGFVVSMFDPVLGFGASYFRIIPQALNLMVGAQVLVSFPNALLQLVPNGGGQMLFDNLFTGVLMARLPIASSNFGVVVSLSTNGRVGVGISLLNFTWLPFLP